MTYNNFVMDVQFRANCKDSLRSIYYFTVDAFGSIERAQQNAREFARFCKTLKGVERVVRKNATVYVKYAG